MPRTRRARIARARGRDRHGRGLRSAVTGPELPPLQTRLQFFDDTVSDALEYLRGLWPEELQTAQLLIADAPGRAIETGGIARWQTDRRRRTVILYRVPIERLAHLHRDDDWHRRSYIESCVFRAVAELLGRDPWEIAPERFRHF